MSASCTHTATIVLDEPIDLYSEWIDACEAVNQPAPSATRAPTQAMRRAQVDEEEAEGEDDEELPDIGRPRGGRDADADAAGEDDAEDVDLDPDASGDIDPGYERPQGNEKMHALIAQRKARAELEDGDDDED